MTVVWRPRAEEQFRAALRFLTEQNEVAASDMATDVEAAARLLRLRPQAARRSQYPGFFAWSLTKWKKIIIFREMAGGIEIVAFLDARQLPPKTIG